MAAVARGLAAPISLCTEGAGAEGAAAGAVVLARATACCSHRWSSLRWEAIGNGTAPRPGVAGQRGDGARTVATPLGPGSWSGDGDGILPAGAPRGEGLR